MGPKKIGIIAGIIVLVVVLAGGALYWSFAVRQPTYVLKAKYVKEEPVIDGKSGDSVWKEAEEATVPIKGGSPVTLKAVYTKEKAFFLATYKDSTKDSVDEVWEYDGKNWSVGPTADELSLFFDIGDSVIGFQEKGFAVMNQGLKPRDKIFNVGIEAKAPSGRGRLWSGYKQKGDVWEMNVGLTSFYGKAHDLYFAVDPIYMEFAETQIVATASIRSDRFASGVPFIRNNQLSVLAIPEESDVVRENKPVYMLGPGLTVDNAPYPTKEQMVEITDYSVFKKGDKVPQTLFVTGKTWGGSFDDIDGRAYWSNGSWTVEMGRKLNTGHSDDIVFKPGDNMSYGFGVLVRADGRTIRPSPPATLRFVSQGGG